VSVDVEEHPKHIFSLRHFLFYQGSNQLNLCESELHALGIVICEEMAIHVSALRIAPVIAS
jgi:hypothetical protein